MLRKEPDAGQQSSGRFCLVCMVSAPVLFSETAARSYRGSAGVFKGAVFWYLPLVKVQWWPGVS